MATSKTTFDSGQYYTLSQIFSEKHKIIIPDLQRDYCWGDNVWNEKGKKDKELVSGFVDNLLSIYSKKPNDELTLGLIYGYENPRFHIQLCDGQQRITTLFLLLGIINRKTGNNNFQKYLVSDFELITDDKEPFLQYAIRESTLYFLSDLVCDFFLKKEILIDDIIKQNWYFEEYDLDASIKSMLEAIRTIDNKLNEQGSLFDFIAFGNFIINKLQLLYYDMGNRTRGEKTFVIINTTGEPLTATENLKPILIGNIENETDRNKASDEWEKMEEWFWKKRKGAGNKTNEIADYGVREFFRWVTLLKIEVDSDKFKEKLKQLRESANFNFVIKELKPQEIPGYLLEVQKYFKIIQFLFNKDEGILSNSLNWLSPDEKDKHINPQIVWFRLLPVIEYLKRFGNENERNIVRVKTFFENLSRIDSVAQNVGDLLFEAIRIIKEMPSEDIASILQLEKVSTQILSEEEKTKLNLYINSPEKERIELEIYFWNEEKHPIWNGEIMPLLKWSFVDKEFDFKKFKNYCKVFYEVFKGNCDGSIDVIRRALITRGLRDYPRYFRGSTNRSFGWEYNDWKVLINDNSDKFKVFFDELSNTEDIKDILEDMCKNFPVEEKWSQFVHIPELLEYCTEKNIQWWGDSHGWVLIKGKTAKGEHANVNAYKLFIEYKKESKKFWNDSEWRIWFYSKENSCVVFDHNDKKIAIGVKYSGNDLFFFQLFRRETKEIIYQQQLKLFADKKSLNWNNKRYESEKKTKDEITNLLESILNDSEISQDVD